MSLPGSSRIGTDNALPPIPWSFTEAEGGIWLWITPTFRTVISSLGPHGFFWEVTHLRPAGNPQVIASGNCGAFIDSEFAVREIIGKAYKVEAGYRSFAGHLATTFQLANGRWVDFAPLEHSRVLISVRRPDGDKDLYSGMLRVRHFVIDLSTTDGAVSIMPSHIIDVRRDNGVMPPSLDAAKRPTRITPGRHAAGCTGKPGFTQGTVDHFGVPPCPIHETGQ